MSKIAFVFPGQGSQYVGMGREIAEHFSAAAGVFAQADSILEYGLTELCFEGPEEELKLTSNTQPAILTTSIACCQVLKDYGVTPDFVAGHSLGEYSALVTAKALSFEEALPLVRVRGQFMEEAVPKGQGSMAAILGLNADQIGKICRQIAKQEWVETANFNCPGQVVIAGTTKGVKAVMDQAKDMGAKRVISLAVSGPFHSKMMGPASNKLAHYLQGVQIQEPEIPIVANVNAEFVLTESDLKKALETQVKMPVRWEESINLLVSQGVSIFIEVGPGKVLTGIIKKIAKKALLLNVEDLQSLEVTLNKLKGVI